MKIFISYSHKDEKALDRLHTHLAVLKREGTIQTWYDREILPGSEIDNAIIQNLDNSDVFLPLVSPDFLASNYCYEQEMDYAINKHDAEKIRILPVVIEPCDWLSTPLQKFKALPKDGRPISEWENENNAYLGIVNEIRRAINNNPYENNDKNRQFLSNSSIGLSKYRIKKDFDEIDIADFRKRAFQEILTYFTKSIQEIDNIEGVRARITQIDALSFTASILNTQIKRGAGHITIHAKGRKHGFSDISYAFEENANSNLANGGFRIEHDDYDLYLTNGGFIYSDKEQKLQPHESAVIIWNMLLEKSGIEYTS